MEKKYYYHENGKEDKLIEAFSDSAAYLEAYTDFEISKKSKKNVNETFGGNPLEIPTSFELLNEKHEEITYKINFAKRDSLEKSISDLINSLPDNLKESVAEAKSKSNQAGTTDSAQIKTLKPFFINKKDEFDVNKQSWFELKSSPKYRNQNGIYCYFGSENGNVDNFRFVIQYYADDWLFIQKYQFSIDGKAYEFVPNKVDSDSGDGGYIWEWCDQNINSSNVDLIESLANAKEAKIRFVGRQYVQTKVISQKEIRNIKRALDFYKAKGGEF